MTVRDPSWRRKPEPGGLNGFAAMLAGGAHDRHASRSTDAGIHVVYRSGYRPSPDPRTDEQGRFRVEGLVPGLKYNLAWPDRDAAPQQKWKGVVFRNLVLKPGENKDLGSITLQPFPEQ